MRNLVILFLLCFNMAFSQSIKITFKNTDTKKDFVEGRRELSKVNARTMKSHTRINNEFADSKHEFLRKKIWIESPDTNEIRSIYNKMKNDPNIESIEIEPAYSIEVCDDPVTVNDPTIGYQLDLTDARCAWGITTGNPDIWIGVCDTHIDPNHEDLSGKIATVSGNVTGGHNHGTMVSGYITAKPNNGLGVAGTGYNLKVAFHRVPHAVTYSYTVPNTWPRQPCNPSIATCDTGYGAIATGSLSAVILRAFNSGNKVINVSWTGSVSVAEAQAITNGGTVLVVAAGNTTNAGSHFGTANVPGVINVSGVDELRRAGTGGKAKNTWVDICAPAENLITTNATIPGLAGNLNRWNTKYGMGWGTSFASPQVAAIVGLMMSVNPCLTPAQIEEIIKRTADPIADAASFPGLVGAGVINAFKAVKEAATTYIQNNTISFSTINRTFVDIGSNVTTTIGVGAVSLTNYGTVNINAREVYIKNDFEVPLGGTLTINTSPTYDQGCP